MNLKDNQYDGFDISGQMQFGKRGFSLPQTASTTPMPPVKPPRKKETASAEPSNNVQKQRT